MVSVSNIILLLIASNILAAVVLVFQHRANTSNKPMTSFKAIDFSEYRFANPIIAYHVLSKLDSFEQIAPVYLDDFVQTPTSTINYYQSYLGFTTDDSYCERHRAYIADYPEVIFFENNFLMDYMNTSLVRAKVIPSIGVDLLPNVSAAMPEKIKKSREYDIPVNLNVFFVNGPMHVYRQIGKNFACLSQVYNHIPGHSSLNRKDKVAESAVVYAKSYAKRPECFNFDKFFPQTWTLYIKEQCDEFFKNFNSLEYLRQKGERRIVYIRKIGAGAHKAKGVEPVNDQEENEIRKLYENGVKCGIEKKNYIVQQFIHNPLLIEGHKFDFRIYMLVASTNPIMLFYHDGFLRLSLHQYDVNSNDKSVLLTNTDLSIKLIQGAGTGELFNGMNEEELRNFQMWNFTKFHNYLLEKGHVSDRNWLNNYLRPEFKKAMIHLIRMSQHSFLQRSSIFEIFGVDFMLDDELNLWFLECNSSPVLKGTSDEKEKFLVKMLKDQFEIVTGLLRSRMKRVIRLVNEITREVQEEGLALEDFYIKNLNKRRQEFKKITKNKFEPEYAPNINNGFAPIIDENYEDVDRYFNLIPKECLL